MPVTAQRTRGKPSGYKHHICLTSQNAEINNVLRPVCGALTSSMSPLAPNMLNL